MTGRRVSGTTETTKLIGRGRNRKSQLYSIALRFAVLARHVRCACPAQGCVCDASGSSIDRGAGVIGRRLRQRRESQSGTNGSHTNADTHANADAEPATEQLVSAERRDESRGVAERQHPSAVVDRGCESHRLRRSDRVHVARVGSRARQHDAHGLHMDRRWIGHKRDVLRPRALAQFVRVRACVRRTRVPLIVWRVQRTGPALQLTQNRTRATAVECLGVKST